jgi:hypothetical protein
MATLYYGSYKDVQPASRRAHWEMAVSTLLFLLVPCALFYLGSVGAMLMGLVSIALLATIVTTENTKLCLNCLVGFLLVVFISSALHVNRAGLAIGGVEGFLIWWFLHANQRRAEFIRAERTLYKIGKHANGNPYLYAGCTMKGAKTLATLQNPALPLGEDPTPLVLEMDENHPEERMLRNLCKAGDLLDVQPELPAHFVKKRQWDRAYYFRVHRVITPPVISSALAEELVAVGA